MNKNGIMEVTLRAKAAQISKAESVWLPAVPECKQACITTVKM